MLFTVEPLLFQDERRHTIVEQREAGVMSPSDNSKDMHSRYHVSRHGY